mmetsp:Transcript_12573/g.37754  ORF Transcript_12573/g.37754 Transcript_12573/m.37754 type:complete len:191 (-) Transcript_12573:40-612(-)
MARICVAAVAACAVGVAALRSPAASVRQAHSAVARAAIQRDDFLRGAAAAAVLGLAPRANAAATKTDTGLIYEVLKSNPKGAKPKVGDLIAVRFKGAYNGNVFDDLTKTDEPLYLRVGTGNLVPGIEEALPQMRLGDKWALQIPANLAFGDAGRKASAGKPRIPGGADLYYEIEIVAFPGNEGDIYLQDQ